MANPFRRAHRHGAPSIRPTPPESAETPMPDPTQTSDLLQPASSTSKLRDANGTTTGTTADKPPAES